jgi:hypothetical protein
VIEEAREGVNPTDGGAEQPEESCVLSWRSSMPFAGILTNLERAALFRAYQKSSA